MVPVCIGRASIDDWLPREASEEIWRIKFLSRPAGVTKNNLLFCAIPSFFFCLTLDTRLTGSRFSCYFFIIWCWPERTILTPMPRVLIISLPINWHNSYPPFVVYYTKKRQDDANYNFSTSFITSLILVSVSWTFLGAENLSNPLITASILSAPSIMCEA